MSSIDIYNHDLNNTDLNMYHCGFHDCPPGHFYGPAVRDHYLIHIIYNGKGFFKSGETTYYLEKGQGFLISPWETTYYQADFENPWNYCWVGFNGRKAGSYVAQAGLSTNNPIFDYDVNGPLKDYVLQMMDASKTSLGRESKQLGLLYLFLTCIIENTGSPKIYPGIGKRKDLYVQKAVEYIGMNYSRKICVSEISASIGLDRSYMGSIFKDCLNTSIQQFLIDYRISKACELMHHDSLMIGDISRSVGYEDPLLFSKIFKRVMKQSPKAYRKSLHNSGNIST